jgi:undecaprenyl-diphosphatase
VGFSGVNGLFSRLIGYHPVLYTITEFLGIIALLPVVLFGVVGLLQLIQRKSLLAVDKDILVLGGIYIGVLLCYILFNKVVINYRPVILDEGLEASYPSSHTMLAVCVLSTAYKEFQWRLKRSSFKNTLLKTCRVLMVLIVLP